MSTTERCSKERLFGVCLPRLSRLASGLRALPAETVGVYRELFRIKGDSAKDGLNYSIDISLLEVYCDEIRDLLTKEAAQKLEVKQTKEGTHVPGLTRRSVGTYDEVVEAIAEGQTIRATASTNMNAHSSRSHCMLQVHCATCSLASATALRY